AGPESTVPGDPERGLVPASHRRLGPVEDFEGGLRAGTHGSAHRQVDSALASELIEDQHGVTAITRVDDPGTGGSGAALASLEVVCIFAVGIPVLPEMCTPLAFEPGKIYLPAVEGIYQFRPAGVEQHPLRAAVENKMFVGERLRKAPAHLEASAEHGCALEPGVVKKVVEDLARVERGRMELQDLTHA